MEHNENLFHAAEEDLLEKVPENGTITYNNESILLSEVNKDDSGLGISDSMETVKENGENCLDDKGCEAGDLADVDSKFLPQLILLPSNSPDDKKSSLEKLSSSENNLSHDGGLPELQLIPEVNKNSVLENAASQQESRRSSTSSFIDSLLDKLKRNNSDSSGSEISPKKILKECKSSDEDLLVELHNPVSYVKSSNPNMLPTPVVKNQSISSIFVDSEKEYEEALQKNKQKPNSDRNDDRSKMTSKTLPPRMMPPKLPSNIQHPRTLAQKRLLLSNNLNFLVIEQESKIFKQIQRKMNEKDLNYKLIDSFSEDDVPIKHGPWKALSWLRTEEGKYIQQYINIDDQSYKLSGSKGNHEDKYLLSQSSKPFPKNQTTSLRSVRCCEGGKIKKRIIDNLVNVESIKRFILEESLNPYKKLEISLYNQLSSIQPKPLCKKIEYINKNRKLIEKDEDSVFLGDYIKFQMPNVQIEVNPQKKFPLNPIAKQYLNEIIPYRDMNENWINFSLSALCTKETSNEKINDKFEFSIPYIDNKQHMLVREMIKTPAETDFMEKFGKVKMSKIFDKEIKWTFAENCDKNDALEMEIVEIIKDLSNSVCLNLNDDLFTKNDPILRIPSLVAPIKAKEAIESMAATSKNTKTDQSKKMLLELRRLNANVVKSDSNRVDDDEDIRRHALAHLAKDERELRPTVIVTDSDTLLLSNKNTEVRRQKRAPKRYSDYMHTENIGNKDLETDHPPKKSKSKDSSDDVFKTRAQFNETGLTHEEIKTLKDEVKRWIHVNVEITRLENLENIQPYCMFHHFYKCSCKSLIPRGNLLSEFETTKMDNKETEILPETKNSSEIVDALEELPMQDEENSDDVIETEEELKVEDDNSRRVLPVELDKTRKNLELTDGLDLEEENKENAPKMEILNISELVNGGIGPIYIGIYDTKVNRLNPIFRSILNNKSALVYVDGLGYYLDMKKIDIMKLKFDNIREELDHPVFIICPKISQQSEEAAKIQGDFVNILFKEDSELLLQIKDKLLLKEVSRIIEVVLQSVRKKIELQIGCEPNDFVKEQLSLITRDRLNSNSSVSSADTSPLHFNGKKLECAPAPGFDTEMMREFNKIFSMRMQRLCAIIRSNSLDLYPLDGFINKFYIYRWNLLLKSFEEDLIDIWQVKLLSESSYDIYYNYVITNTSKPPTIEGVYTENISNVKKLPLDKTSIIIRMILLRIENSKTKNMTVLLYGCRGYFRIYGVMNSKDNYFEKVTAKPTKLAHPRLTAKIQKVYNIWHGLKKAADKNDSDNKEEKMTLTTKIEEVEIFDSEKESVNMSLDKSESKIQHNKPKEVSETKNIDNSKQVSSYKWFLFNIENDFSDIFIKQWKNYLPYLVVMDAIKKAKLKQKTIRILGPLNSAKDTPKIFALHKPPLKFKKGENLDKSGNFLLFGPYLRDSNSNLLLMQKCNGKMLLRDDFEHKNNIQRELRTRCLWIYANSLKCVTDSFIECTQPSWNRKRENIESRHAEVQDTTDSDVQENFKKRRSD